MKHTITYACTCPFEHFQAIGGDAAKCTTCNPRPIPPQTVLLNACKLALTRLNDGTEVTEIIARHVRNAISQAEKNDPR